MPEAYAHTQILCLGVAILMHLGYYPEAGATLVKWSKQVAVAQTGHTALSMNDLREALATGKLLKTFDIGRWPSVTMLSCLVRLMLTSISGCRRKW